MSALRQPYYELSAEAMQGLLATKAALERGPLGKALVELLYLRVSQLNGCAYCLEKHSESLREEGVSQLKLDSLAGWRVSRHFDAREQAALAWAESLNDVASSHAADDDYLPLEAYFSPREISDLTIAVALMSGLNRLAIGMRL
ncbi:carboxymuconolactone decarboxylase family protein [Ectopseudomonas composti]